MQNQKLWQSIEDFSLDQPQADYDFCTRLAFENNWAISFSQTAITEYKKFMYLAAISDRMVSPSAIVDVVWHQHLIFTQSYQNFCQLLEKKIEHIPSTHRAGESRSFAEARARTLELYEREFGRQPAEWWDYPTDLEAISLRRTNWNPLRSLMVTLVFIVLASHPAVLVLRPIWLEIDGPLFLFGYTVAFGLLFLMLKLFLRSVLKKVFLRWHRHRLLSNLTPAELLYLRENKIEPVIHDHVNQMLTKKYLYINNENKIEAASEIENENIFQKNITAVLLENGKIKYPQLVALVKVKPAFEQIVKAMNRLKHFLQQSWEVQLPTLVVALVFGDFFVIGISRLLVGIENDRPILFLSILLILFIFIAIVTVMKAPEVLNRITIPGTYQHHHRQNPAANGLEWSYFMLGGAVLATSFQPLVAYSDQHNKDTSSGNSSCAGSGGDGGSSCGGGGGCGGCGGGGD